MTKYDFITNLERQLYSLPQLEKEHLLNFYNETIEDRMEDGMKEEEAINSLGSIEDIVAQIFEEKEEPKHIEAKNPQKRLGRILLLVISSPLWLSMFAAAFMLYLALWLVLIGVIGVVVGLGLFLVMGLWNLIPILQANQAAGIVLIGSLLLSIGVMPFLCYGEKKVAIWLCGKSMDVCAFLKKLFIKVVQ